MSRFFFSSRRRHTRSLCDWSSDVCSSDLNQEFCEVFMTGARVEKSDLVGRLGQGWEIAQRSEERRVGKEGRYRTYGYRLKKKSELYLGLQYRFLVSRTVN